MFFGFVTALNLGNITILVFFGFVTVLNFGKVTIAVFFGFVTVLNFGNMTIEFFSEMCCRPLRSLQLLFNFLQHNIFLTAIQHNFMVESLHMEKTFLFQHQNMSTQLYTTFNIDMHQHARCCHRPTF